MTTRIASTNIQNATIELSNMSAAAIAALSSTTPTITQIQITNSSYVVLDDTAVSTSGGYIKITGTNFTAGSQVVIGNVTATSVGFVNSTTLNVQVPAQAAGTYIVYLTVNTGSVAILVNGLTYSGTPTWVTGSTLPTGVQGTALSVQLTATGDAPLTYALAAGSSLPPGLTLSSGGLISGTVTGLSVQTLYNFTVNAIDAEAQDSPRAFDITILVSDPFFENVTALLSASTPTSTFVTDASTNSFNVTVNGDTRPNNFGPYTPGYYSNLFNATGQYLSIPYSAAFNLTGDFTVECWIYPGNLPASTGVSPQSYARIFSFGTYNAANSLGLEINSDSGNVRRWVSWYNGTAYNLSSQNAVTTDIWYHIALVRSGTTITFYLNGVSTGTITSASAAVNTNQAFYIASLQAFENNSSAAFNGYISNFRLVKGTAVYTSNFTPPTQPLTAITNTSLLTCQSNRFIDTSSNAFTVTVNGSTQLSGFDPFVPSSSFAGRGSAYFDGAGDFLSISADACPRGTEDFTIEFWYYPLSLSSAERYFVVGSASNGLIFGITYSGNDIGIIRDVSGAGVVNFGSRTQLTVNAWNYIAVTRSGTTFRCYINGSPTTTPSGTSDYSFATPSTTFIAAGSTFGNITDLRIVRGTALYTGATMTVPTAPLTAVANTSLLTLQNNQPNNNNMFLDNSTSNFNITRNGNTTQGSFSPYGGGWSNYFDGSSSLLYTQSGSTFPAPVSFLNGASGIGTIEFWVYPLSSSQGANIYDFPPVIAVGDTYFSLGITTGNKARFYWWTGAPNSLDSTGTVSFNTWTHVAAVRNGTTVTLYVNGVSSGSISYTGWSWASASNGTILNIGLTSPGSARYFNGYVSNLRVVNGTAVYTATFTPPTAPFTPITNTSLLTCADNRFIDDSASNYLLTRNGSPTVQRFNPFNPVTTTPTSYSGYFDGTGDYLTLVPGSAFAFETGNFTVECWYYPTSTPTYGYIVDARNSGQTNNWVFGYGLTGVNPGDSGKFGWFDGSTVLQESTVSTITNRWNHLCYVRSGTTGSLFVNGVRVATATNSTNFNVSPTISYIGQRYSSAPDQIIFGYISNLRTVKGTAVYDPTQSTLTVPTTPLTAVANTSLLTLQSPTFIDNSTNNFTITNNGDTAPRQFNPFGWTNTTGSSAAYTTALYGGSAYFDGNGDHLSLTNVLPLRPGSGDFTIETWIYRTGATGGGAPNATLYGTQWSGGSPSGAYILYLNSSYNVAYAVWNSNIVQSTSTINIGQWYHIAVTRSGTTNRLFINGVLEATATSSADANNSAYTVLIGRYNDPGVSDGYLTGYMSDLRFTKGTARYISNFQPPVAPLTALQNTVLLNNMTGASIYDSAMMGNYETVNTAQISTSVRPFGSGGSIAVINSYLDGCAIASSPQFAFGTGNWTVEGWFYTSQSGSTKQTLVLNLNQATGMSMSVSTTSVEFRSNGTTDISGSGVSSNTWTYIAWVRNGNTVTIYRNGTSIVSGTYTNSIGPSAFYVGPTGGQSGVANTFNYIGYIADLRITRGVARYTSNFTPPTTPFLTF